MAKSGYLTYDDLIEHPVKHIVVFVASYTYSYAEETVKSRSDEHY